MDDEYGVGMTREAKIGLLVALAFVLVIGILLSDHVTTSTREPGAPLAAVEQSIRGSITAPGTTPPILPPQQEPDPTIQPVTGAPAGTPFVFVPDPAGSGDIRVEMHTPPATPQEGSDELASADPGLDSSPQWENDAPPSNTATFSAPPADGAGASETNGRQTITDMARAAGEELVPAGQQPGSRPGNKAVAEYTVQKGDSLSKITAKFLGRDTPANRDLLLSLNPDLRRNPDMIQVGDVYKVPSDTQAAAALRGTTADATTTEAPAPPQAPKKTERPAKGRTYTVKAGDSLWAIAESELGSGARMKEILKLNSDQIANADAIAEGMTLKLPA